ncbi:protein psi1-like [Cornus florida]|uniref:protein psi1-like n=1 Tax=Cornus florida TaxID=4283 RepID=UPI0028A2987C|nr:protein psi1-like [Cornus florida]
MADRSRSPPQDSYNILCIGGIFKAYKSLVSKRHLKKINKVEAQDNLKSFKARDDKSHRVKTRNGDHEDRPANPRSGFRHRTPSPLSRSESITSPLSRSKSASFSRNASRKSVIPISGPAATFSGSLGRKSTDAAGLGSLSRSTSRRSSTAIMYSNSSGLLKPPAIEHTLECTLEELCFGCTKKIKITREVATNNGQVVEEEENLTIKVKPGWTQGTKIKFEGMGNETPGTYPGDVNFRVSEKDHPVFTREGDNLEIAIEIPLVKALTGGDVMIPLLGGEKMSLPVDDIIYPGYEKIIEGQGMPKTKEHGRGNLIISFLVEFPMELSDEQRSEVFSILQDTC